MNAYLSVLRCIKDEKQSHASIGKFGKPCKSFEEAELVLDAAFESVARILYDRAERRRWNGAENGYKLPSATRFASICRVMAGGK